MLRLVTARCRPRRLQLALAPPPTHRVSALCPPVSCKRESERFFSSDPSLVRPTSRSVWQKTVSPALRTFLKLRGHLLVPVSFVVPGDDASWPEEIHGYPLGKHAEWLRRRWRSKRLPEFAVQELEELDFAFDLSQYKWDHFVKPALLRFYEVNGHTDVPQSFRVKHGDAEWPERLWGFYLGPRVLNIRHRGDFKAQLLGDAEELAGINFCYDSTTYDRDWRERVLPSLQAFRQEFGHCDVHRSFKVPDCPPWPKAAAGVHLGVSVNNIRSKGYYAEQVARDDAELKKLEFVWDHSFTEWKQRIFPTLEAYKHEKGHCHVPIDFVVPSTKPWPDRAHGLKLGVLLGNIHRFAYYFDRIARNMDQLASVGFDLQIAQVKWDQRVEPMLVTFKELHGHRNVPREFVVPSEAPWKKNDWGIQLGKLKPKKTWVWP
ncbi:hypothetical protein PHYPSEUDO_009280 [Phytophthora pseudosyringae]|uniref:Helicase-associated domain-containing protein n=1 Tax=Phytophthora pseudosyringae TaxID=221518 RepID=A0A8T1VFD0_9STRA|nr:hypothetical protein PHYPSEUDO_009280 [Phytophthora pseudosyringae]